MKEKIIDIALNASGIRDTARVLKISMNTVMATFDKTLILITFCNAFIDLMTVI